MKCIICDKECISFKQLVAHVYHSHNLKSKKYYDIYLKKENEGICCSCEKETFFKNISKGYCEFCSTNCSTNSNTVKEKTKNTFIRKYGVESSNKSELVKQHKKEAALKKYGVDHYSKTDYFKKKQIDNNIKRYGVKNIFQLENIKEKIRKTCLERYEVTNPAKNESIKNKFKKTCVEKFGVDNPNKLKEILEKRKNTVFKKNLPYVLNLLEKNNLKLEEKYITSKKKIKLKCLNCETVFETYTDYIRRGCGFCPVCYPKFCSIAEQEIKYFLKSLNLKIVENSKKIIFPYELDIFIPEKKFAIEYNGLYWHSEIQGKNKMYHLNKLNMCSKKDITLIQIFEDEWLFKKEIVKNRLKQLLNISDSERIHGRKCKIKEIPNYLKNEFLNTYHIQGQDTSSIRLGAFYRDELVSVMTFSKGSIAKGASLKKDFWELNRFCSNYCYHIPGVASKLLSYFIKNYKWSQIYSYADRRWSIGKVYKVLGFTEEHCTSPNYWYVKQRVRYHRYGFRKRPDEPKDIPEWILRINEGYIRVWDCGVIKFKLKNLGYTEKF